MLITPNTFESDRHNLRIGVLKEENLVHIRQVIDEVFSEKFDIVKLHISTANLNQTHLLNKLHLPWMLHYSSTLYELDLAKYKPYPVTHTQNIEVKQCFDVDLARDMIARSLPDVKEFYFYHPLISRLYPIDTVLASHIDFVSQFPLDTTGKTPFYIAYVDGVPTTYMAFINNDERTIATAYLGGTVPEYRMLKIGKTIYKMVAEQFLIPQGFKKYVADIQIQNIGSIKTAQMEGYGLQPSTAFNRILLYPMVSYAEKNNSSGPVYSADGYTLFANKQASILTYREEYA